MPLGSASATLRPMNDEEKTRHPGPPPGMKQYFTLGLGNPLLKYGSWMLFLLLVIRLTFVGFKGTPVPEVGEKSTAYYVAPRAHSCAKPNPKYSSLVEEARNQVSPVYAIDNSFLVSRENQLRDVEEKLSVDLEKLREIERELESLDLKSRDGGKQLKDSPFYKKDQPVEPTGESAANDAAARKELLEQSQQAMEHAIALLGTVAPGLARLEAESIVRGLRRSDALMRDVFRAASISLEEIRRWLIVETADFAFQRDRARGIVLARTGRWLNAATHVFSYVEALDQIRGKLVYQVISENFPRLKGKKQFQGFVAQVAVASMRANLGRDENRTRSALEEALGRVPDSIPVEFAQGQTIVAMGETVQDWQRDCIAKFSTRTIDHAEMGQFLGLPVPMVLLLLGLGLMAVVASLALVGFSRRIFGDFRLEGKDYLSVGVLFVLHLALVRLFLMLAGVLSLTYPELSKGTLLVASPVALSVMVLNTLLGTRVSFLGMLYLLLMTSLVAVLSGPELLSGNFSTYYTIYVLSVCLVGIWVTRHVTRRGGFFLAGAATAGAGVLFWLVVLLLEGGQVPMNHALQLGLASIASGALSYILLISLTPVFEYLWDYTTDSRLVELASSDHPALKELSRRAPGTYQHSLWIATLVEDAAERIKGNPLLAKVGAYYHDLGKLMATSESGLHGGAADSPLYFAENQTMGNNPHDHLPPAASARILRKHVEQSIKMIDKYRLGKKVRDIAAQHHGTSLMAHFYNRALINAESDGGTVRDGDFRYPGPRPQSKEAALVMLADSVEAAVRALPQHTEEKISERVSDIVSKRVADGQLDDSTLTFGDVNEIIDSFVKNLVSMYHARPEYLKAKPEEKTVRLQRDELGDDGEPDPDEAATVRLEDRDAAKVRPDGSQAPAAEPGEEPDDQPEDEPEDAPK